MAREREVMGIIILFSSPTIFFHIRSSFQAKLGSKIFCSPTKLTHYLNRISLFCFYNGVSYKSKLQIIIMLSLALFFTGHLLLGIIDTFY